MVSYIVGLAGPYHNGLEVGDLLDLGRGQGSGHVLGHDWQQSSQLAGFLQVEEVEGL